MPTARQEPELPAPSLLPPGTSSPASFLTRESPLKPPPLSCPASPRTREPGGQLHHQRGPGGPGQGPCRSPAPTKHAQPLPPSFFHPLAKAPQISTSDTPVKKGRTKALAVEKLVPAGRQSFPRINKQLGTVGFQSRVGAYLPCEPNTLPWKDVSRVIHPSPLPPHISPTVLPTPTSPRTLLLLPGQRPGATWQELVHPSAGNHQLPHTQLTLCPRSCEEPPGPARPFSLLKDLAPAPSCLSSISPFPPKPPVSMSTPTVLSPNFENPPLAP